jgi:hypothetical protein
MKGTARLLSRPDDGIVVVRGREGHGMDMQDVPAALHQRLGADATRGLLDLFDRARNEMREDVISVCTERFERRLVEQISGVRVQIAQLEASYRQDSTETRAGLRQEVIAARAELRQEITEARAELRQEITEARAELRQEIAAMGGTLRQEIGEMGGALRHEMAAMGGALRHEMAATGGALGHEMAAMGGTLRQEIAAMGGALRQEIATGRVELLKWCFLFWIGQVFAIATILGVILRLYRP